MVRVGVWERYEGLKIALGEALDRRGRRDVELLGAAHPAELVGEDMDLLVVSPGATGWAGAAGLSCRLLLLPGSAGVLTRGMQAEEAVSYGSGAKNTITLSSLEEGRICLAIQRELVTVAGRVVERQELVLPYQDGEENPELFMARTGALLLLGEDVTA